MVNQGQALNVQDLFCLHAKRKIQQKQQPKEESFGHEDIWTSAFDSQTGVSAEPPPLQLKASVGGGDADEPSEEHHETVIFSLAGVGGDDAEDEGKRIMVKIPPDLDGAAALVHVVMEMMRLTESEAQTMIVKEGIQWENYRPQGSGTDADGNVIQIIRYKKKFSERRAHEPEALSPLDVDGHKRFEGFKSYLLKHDGDNIRDPYEQYDRWAKEEGFFVEGHQGGVNLSPGMYGDATQSNQQRDAYEHKRTEVVEFVVWERLRSKRESLAEGIPHEKTSLNATIESMADSFPSIVDMSLIQEHVPGGYYSSWVGIHAEMILLQGALERGDITMFRNKGLGPKLYRLAYWFAAYAQQKFGVTSSSTGKQHFEGFDAVDVNALDKLAKATDFGVEEGQLLLYQYYKLTFAIMEVVGQTIAHATEKTILNGHEDKEAALQGRQLENQGTTGKAILDLKLTRPNAQKVNATFYPEVETKDFRQGGEQKGGDDWSNGISLELYLWHDDAAGEWVLEDFSNLDSKKQNRAAGAADKPVPAALFEKLNSKFRFPKGALFYRVPSEGSYRILRTTEPTEWYEWLRFAAMAGIAVGMAIASMGASIPATVMMVASSASFAVADGAEMQDKASHGMLTNYDIALRTASMLACVTAAAGASMKLGMATRNALEGIEGFTGVQQSVIRVVAGVQLGADTPCLALFTHEALASLQEAAGQDPEGKDAFPRLLSFLFQMGMQGVMLVGMRKSMLEMEGRAPMGHGEVPVEKKGGGSRVAETSASKPFQKIDQGSSDLGKLALEHRVALQDPTHEGNVAVFEFVDREGNLVRKAFATVVGDKRHAEVIGREFLMEQGIPFKNVRRIFSELEPCELSSSNCKAIIQRDFPNAEVSFAYDYPGTDHIHGDIRRSSKSKRDQDIKKRFGKDGADEF